MIQQEQMSPRSSSLAPPDDLIDSLLQEQPLPSKFPPEDHFQPLHLQIPSQRIDLGKDDPRPFDLGLLDKQDSVCLFDQGLELDPPEKELLLGVTVPSCTTASSPVPLKRESKMDRSAYLEESRQAKIARYLEKKKRRIWDRKIFYDCRKVVADNRQRVNGRFVKKSPGMPGKDATNTQKTSATPNDLECLQEFSLQGVHLCGFQL